MDEQYTLERANRLVSDWISTQPEEVKAQQAAVEYYGKYFAPENINAVTRTSQR